MNRKSIVQQIILLSAALNKEGFNNPTEQEQNTQVITEVLENPFFAHEVQEMEKTNIIFFGKQGFIPTVKGWKSLQPKVQVVEKIKPFNRTRIPQDQLVPMTTSLIEEVCYRYKNHPAFKPFFNEQLEILGEAYNCLNEVIVDTLTTPQEVVEVETPEIVKEVKTRKLRKKVEA